MNSWYEQLRIRCTRKKSLSLWAIAKKTEYIRNSYGNEEDLMVKVYLVEQSFRDWDEGWDCVLSVYTDRERAETKASCLNDAEQDDKISYYVVAKEVIE